MALMVPVAAYLGAYTQIVRHDYFPNEIVPGAVATELAMLAVTGVAILCYRRPGFRGAIVQLTTTPVLLQICVAIAQTYETRAVLISIGVSLTCVGLLGLRSLHRELWRRSQGGTREVLIAIAVGAVNLAVISTLLIAGQGGMVRPFISTSHRRYLIWPF